MDAATPAAATPTTGVPTWWPTRKWWAATVLAVAGILTTWATQDWAWSNELTGIAITLGAQRVVAYLIPNQDTPGGVPVEGGRRL